MAGNLDTTAQAIIDAAAALKKLSSMDMFPRTNEDRKFQDLVQKTEDVEKGQRENTKQMIKALKDTAKKNNVEIDVKDFKDVMKFEDTTKAMNKILNVMSSRENVTFETKDELDSVLATLEIQAESVGTSLKEMGITTSEITDANGNTFHTIKKYDETVEKLSKDTKVYNTVLAESTNETRKHADKVNFASKWLSKLGATAKVIGKDFINLAETEQRFAQQNAVADAGWIKAVTDLQITTIDYMKILKDTRIESLAMASAGIDFKDSLKSGQESLLRFTASSTEAALVSKEFHKNVALMGVSQGKLGDAVLDQTDIYKKHYRVLGYSAEEFANLTQELVNDQGMRSTLLSLQEDERKAYVQGIQQRTAEYLTMGYTIERSKELQKTFQDIIGMNPKDRMKKAAKERAMMGAMGMGAEAAELFKLTTGLRTSKTRESDQKRMTEIRGKAASKFGEMSGSQVGRGQAMSMQMMADSTGFTDIANKFETESGKGRTVDAQSLVELKKQADSNNEIATTTSDLLRLQDTWRAASGTGLTSIATNLLSGFSRLAAINIAGFATNALAIKTASALGGGMPGAGAAKGGGKMLMKGGAVLAAGAIGYEIGTLITEYMKTSDPEAYAEASFSFGRTVDHIADIFGGVEADQRIREEDIRRAAKEGDSKELMALLKEQNELQREAIEDAKKSRGELITATKEIPVNYTKQSKDMIQQAQETDRFKQNQQRTQGG